MITMIIAIDATCRKDTGTRKEEHRGRRKAWNDFEGHHLAVTVIPCLIASCRAPNTKLLHLRLFQVLVSLPSPSRSCPAFRTAGQQKRSHR